MAGATNTPPPLPLADAEHPLVAALSIFAPGINATAARTESEAEGDADLFEALARPFVRLGPV